MFAQYSGKLVAQAERPAGAVRLRLGEFAGQAEAYSESRYWDDLAATERANAAEGRAFQEQVERMERDTGPAARALSEAYARDVANGRDN
jgi:hypothetical protein